MYRYCIVGNGPATKLKVGSGSGGLASKRCRPSLFYAAENSLKEPGRNISMKTIRKENIQAITDDFSPEGEIVISEAKQRHKYVFRVKETKILRH
jgi:hypothetical protein